MIGLKQRYETTHAAVIGCVYHHTSGIELRFPYDFQGDFGI